MCIELVAKSYKLRIYYMVYPLVSQEHEENPSETTKRIESRTNPGVMESNAKTVSGVEWVKKSPLRIFKSDRVAKASRQEQNGKRRGKFRLALLTKQKLGVLKLIQVKVGGAKESFSNELLNRVER